MSQNSVLFSLRGPGSRSHCGVRRKREEKQKQVRLWQKPGKKKEANEEKRHCALTKKQASKQRDVKQEKDG